MGKFNQKVVNNTTNLAGGKAYDLDKHAELVSILLTSFGDDKYYRTAKEEVNRLKELIDLCDKQFVAKSIIYARTQFGMRSITHIASSILAKYISGSFARNFFNKVIYRVDDMGEILAYHKLSNQKVSNSMKKGFADSISRFNEYQLAKYKGEDKEFKLVDIVNLVHPIPNEINSIALHKLINGELKSFDTWEAELSAVGSDVNKKKEVWYRLLDENKLGYFALLRNIRNIVSLNDEELLDLALNALIDEKAIKKSLVLPFRYATAYRELSNINGKAMKYINRACDISCNNVPILSGKTLVALDVSGSMDGKPSEIASVFTAILLKSNDCDLITFSDNANYKNINTDDSVLSIADNFRYSCGGTNFPSIFTIANKKYDRVVLLSDMQSWKQEIYSPSAAFNKYKQLYNSNCKFYSFDLAGYGTLQIPQKDVYCLAGFSDKIFDIMKYYESDKNALINEINTIEL